MKLRARIPYYKLLATLAVLQIMGVAFVHFRESILLNVTQFFCLIGLALIGVLTVQQRGRTWGENSPLKAKSAPLWKGVNVAAFFLFFSLFIWQINYLSLSQSQPLMFSPEGMPFKYDVAPGDLLGYTLRLVIQTWCLALALALVFNRVPRGTEFGFIRGHYQKLSTLAWYLGLFASSAVMIVVLFTLGLLTLDLGKFISKSFGADVMNVPQMDLFVLVFSLYMFNIATRFTKKLKEWGQDPNTSLVFIICFQMLFLLVVYCMTFLMKHYLPGDTVYALMQPIYLPQLDLEKFPTYWTLFVTALSIFMVPLLGSYFYRACEGEPVLRSVIRLLVIPATICVFALTVIPTAQSIFWSLTPEMPMYRLRLDDETSRYLISWSSYASALILLALMLFLKGSKNLSSALIDVMPAHMSRRQRRVKFLYTRTFTLFMTLLLMYLVAGVMVSLYLTSMVLMATMLGLGLCYVAGLKRQEA